MPNRGTVPINNLIGAILIPVVPNDMVIRHSGASLAPMQGSEITDPTRATRPKIDTETKPTNIAVLPQIDSSQR